MPLFRKPAPPLWYVLYPPKNPASEEEPKREGPYKRSAIIQLHADGRLSDGALIWTNEKIFPNALKPRSPKLVHLHEWRRLDQLPDPVYRQIDQAARDYSARTSSVHVAHPENQVEPPPNPSVAEMIQLRDGAPKHPPPPGDGSNGGKQKHNPHVSQPSSAYPSGAFNTVDNAASSVYPAGSSAALSSRQKSPSHSPQSSAPGLPGAYPQPSSYPQPGAYPQGTSPRQ